MSRRLFVALSTTAAAGSVTFFNVLATSAFMG